MADMGVFSMFIDIILSYDLDVINIDFVVVIEIALQMWCTNLNKTLRGLFSVHKKGNSSIPVFKCHNRFRENKSGLQTKPRESHHNLFDVISS